MTLDTFTTARLSAERLTPKHRDEIVRMHQDARVMAMLGGVRDNAKTQDYLDRNLAHWDTHGFGLWILRDRMSGEMIGRGLLRHLDVQGQDDIETGYAFYPPWWGKGLATEISLAALAFAFNDLNLDRIVAFTLTDNQASRRVMEHCGFIYDRDIVHAGLPHVLCVLESRSFSMRS